MHDPAFVGLPALPPFPSAAVDVTMIERAQRAAVFGPISSGDLQHLVQLEGNMARAQMRMAKKFMLEKLNMSEEDVRKCSIQQVCSTDGDNLLVKFGSVSQARLLNPFKKNLPRDSHVNDFVPPCLATWEQVLTDHGNRIRTEKSSPQFQVCTRHV